MENSVLNGEKDAHFVLDLFLGNILSNIMFLYFMSFGGEYREEDEGNKGWIFRGQHTPPEILRDTPLKRITHPTAPRSPPLKRG